MHPRSFSVADHMKLWIQSVVCYTLLKILTAERGRPLSFSIIRMEKLKQPAIKGIQFHNQRERDSETNPDIQKEDSYLNYDLHNSELIDYNKEIQKKIEDGVETNRKIRKDAVRLCEFLVTSDRAFFEDLPGTEEKKFFDTAYNFLADRYGKENVVYASVHKDEKTPHMHLGFVPITEDKRLSAKDFFGKRQQLIKLQDDYNKHMKGAGFDLERGISSDRKHIEQTRFKAETAQEKLNQVMDGLEQVSRLRQGISSLDQIKMKKSMTGKVVLEEDDFQRLKNVAKSGMASRSVLKISDEKFDRLKEVAGERIDRLNKEIKQLEREKVDLKFENRMLAKEKQILSEEKKDLIQERDGLKRENNTLEKSLAEVKERFTKFYDIMRQETNHYLDRLDPSEKLKKIVATAVHKAQQAFIDKEKAQTKANMEKGSEKARERSDDELEL